MNGVSAPTNSLQPYYAERRFWKRSATLRLHLPPAPDKKPALCPASRTSTGQLWSLSAVSVREKGPPVSSSAAESENLGRESGRQDRAWQRARRRRRLSGMCLTAQLSENAAAGWDSTWLSTTSLPAPAEPVRPRIKQLFKTNASLELEHLPSRAFRIHLYFKRPV